MVEYKGKAFNGVISGASYDWFTSTFGNIHTFYNQIAALLPLRAGMHVLDLGCGTGSFGLTVANHIGTTGKIYGVDLANKQLEHARHKTRNAEVPYEFHRASIDELPFDDASFDGIVSVLVFHHVPPTVRRGAIREVARVLKPGGFFALVDVSKPRFGILGLIGVSWYASRAFDPSISDFWDNTFPIVCSEHNLTLTKDVYVNQIIRCQVFCTE